MSWTCICQCSRSRTTPLCTPMLVFLLCILRSLHYSRQMTLQTVCNHFPAISITLVFLTDLIGDQDRDGMKLSSARLRLTLNTRKGSTPRIQSQQDSSNKCVALRKAPCYSPSHLTVMSSCPISLGSRILEQPNPTMRGKAGTWISMIRTNVGSASRRSPAFLWEVQSSTGDGMQRLFAFWAYVRCF